MRIKKGWKERRQAFFPAFWRLVGFIDMLPVAFGHPVALQAGIVAFGDIGRVKENGEEILIGIVRPLGGEPLGFGGSEIVEVGVVQIVD